MTFASKASSPAQVIQLNQAGFQVSSFSTFTVSVTGSSLCVTALGAIGGTGNYDVTVTPALVGSCTLQFSSQNGGVNSIGVSVTGP
jgi:hypothetical protein